MPLNTRPVLALLSLCLAFSACERSGSPPPPATSAAPSASAPASPAAPAVTEAPSADALVGLPPGAQVPPAELRTIDNQPVMLSSLYRDKPLVLVFFRGSWCPYCTRSLAAWTPHLNELSELGATLVAITPEKPDPKGAMQAKHGISMTVLSDASMQAARGFRLSFSLDEPTRTTYKGYGIDLASRNAVGDWELPHPATYVIDTAGTIRYAYAQTDYTKRAAPEEVLAALRAMK